MTFELPYFWVTTIGSIASVHNRTIGMDPIVVASFNWRCIA